MSSSRSLSVALLSAVLMATCPALHARAAEAPADLGLGGAPAPGRPAAAISELREVTRRLREGDASRELAARRRQLLAQLIEDHPGAVLRARLTAQDRAGLPSGLDDLLEEEIAAEGELTVVHEDGPGRGRYHYILAVGERRLSTTRRTAATSCSRALARWPRSGPAPPRRGASPSPCPPPSPPDDTFSSPAPMTSGP